MSRIATTRLILSRLTLSQLSQYIPYIVRSLLLWWLDPVCKLTHALYGLGRPFEIHNSKRKLFYYLSNAPPCIACGMGLPCIYRSAMRLLPTSDNCVYLIFRGNVHKIHLFTYCYFSAKAIFTFASETKMEQLWLHEVKELFYRHLQIS